MVATLHIDAGVRQGGFTLIEMLVVTAIVAIASTIAISAFREYSASQTAISAANELLGDLQLARGEALKRADGARLTPSAGDWSAGWRLENYDGSQVWNERTLARRTVVSSVTGDQSIQFDRWGAVATPTGGTRFDICVEIDAFTGVRRQVTVSATGRAEVNRAAGSREHCS
jgi:type IV fimbrial biogenesis protein FimT